MHNDIAKVKIEKNNQIFTKMLVFLINFHSTDIVLHRPLIF